MGFEDAFENAGIVKKPKEQKKQKHHNHQNRANQQKPINKTHIANPSFYFYKDKAYGKDIEKFKLNNTFEHLFSIKDAKLLSLLRLIPDFW